MELITYTAKRVKATLGAFAGYNTTEIRRKDGTLICVFPPEQKQPRKGCKKLIINCFTYAINWI